MWTAKETSPAPSLLSASSTDLTLSTTLGLCLEPRFHICTKKSLIRSCDSLCLDLPENDSVSVCLEGLSCVGRHEMTTLAAIFSQMKRLSIFYGKIYNKKCQRRVERGGDGKLAIEISRLLIYMDVKATPWKWTNPPTVDSLPFLYHSVHCVPH